MRADDGTYSRATRKVAFGQAVHAPGKARAAWRRARGRRLEERQTGAPVAITGATLELEGEEGVVTVTRLAEVRSRMTRRVRICLKGGGHISSACRGAMR